MTYSIYDPLYYPEGVPNPDVPAVHLYPTYAEGPDYSRPMWTFPQQRQPLEVVERNGVAGLGCAGGCGRRGVAGPDAGGTLFGFGIGTLLTVAPTVGAAIGALGAWVATETSTDKKIVAGAVAGGLIGGMTIFMLGLVAMGGGGIAGALAAQRPPADEA